MGRFRTILTDLGKILGVSRTPPKDRLRLCGAYARIVVKRYCEGRWCARFMDLTREKFLGLTVIIDSYSSFYWTFREIFVHNDYYFETTEKQPRIVDCGGNIGLSVLYFKYWYPRARIRVFEALPANAALLKQTVAANRLNDVDVVEGAVGGTAGTMTLYGGGRAATLKGEFMDRQKKKSTAEPVSVPVELLSPYLTDAVDFLKMDIEGAEGEVIAELARNNALSRVRACAIEYHHFSETENRLEDILAALAKNGLRARVEGGQNGRQAPGSVYKRMVYATRT